MIIRAKADIRASEITPESVYLGRRKLLKQLGLGAIGLTAFGQQQASSQDGSVLPEVKRPSPFDTDEALTTYEDVTTYNNYYEFGTSKSDPAENAGAFEPRPWKLQISGQAENTGSFDLDDFLAPHQLEERIYRMRCVEAWSMVVPWVGIPLAKVIEACQPNSNAKYVAFYGLHDRQRMPGQRFAVLNWPYREGLRIDEAMHPLSMLVVGLYGRTLPNQNGAPLRLIVPWKYGFKGIKAIAGIEFTERQPSTSWNAAAPGEYGFYANVNPAVDHPRWSQSSERRLAGSGFGRLFAGRVDTLPFNGYADQVASLYTDLDLVKNF